MDINYLGNVGIGTTSPSYLLDVKTPTSGVGGVMRADGNTTGLVYLDVQNENTGTGGNGSIMRLISENSAGTGSVSFDLVKYASGYALFNNNDSTAVTAFGTAGSGKSCASPTPAMSELARQAPVKCFQS